jgi:hypothetical protein
MSSPNAISRLFACSFLAALGLALAVAVGGGSPAIAATASRAATPHTEIARSGSWRALYTYSQASPQESGPRFVDQHFEVAHGAKAVLETGIADGMWPGGFGGGRRSIFFRDLDGNGAPEFVLTLWSGGPYCCSVWEIYRFANDVPHRVSMDFGEGGVKLVKIRGRVLLLASDSTFSDRYVAHSDTGYPIKIWRYKGNALADVTRNYPDRLRNDARVWWKDMRAAIAGDGRSPRCYGAAWAADEARLGLAAEARATLLGYANHGLLPGSDGDRSPVAARAFVKSLWADLHSLGYLKR